MAVFCFFVFVLQTLCLSLASASSIGFAVAPRQQQWHLLTQSDPIIAYDVGFLRTPRGGATRQKPAMQLPSVRLGESSEATAAGNTKHWFSITKSEFPQFAAMSLMMFLFIYIFTTVRDTKDTLVVSNCGAEAIPFLKLYGVMPCAMLFIVGYSKLSNIFSSKSTLFYVTLLPFFAFYTLFAFVLYPNRDTLHFLPTSGTTSAAMSLIRYWSFSLYFIASELWASAGVPLLFWTCANDVTMLSEAKRFYPLFAVVGNLAPIVSGKVMSAIVALQVSSDDAAFGQTLKYLALVKIVACLGICVLYRSVNSMANAKLSAESSLGAKKSPEAKINTKTKPTLRESIVELSKSSELRSMATMVICYNACIELTEVLWKAILRKRFTNKSDYMSFMGSFSQIVGISAFVLQLFASGIIQNFGWRWAALITPLSMAAMAVPFFASVAVGDVKIPLATALLIGTSQNVISKITKYSLFDPCKEMAYIPLGPEAKVKGKAAVDVLGSRLGRSIGSASQQFLVLLAGGSILRCAPALGVLYLIAILFWCSAVEALSKLVETDSTKRK